MRDDWCNISTEDFSHRQAAKLKIRLYEITLWNRNLTIAIRLLVMTYEYETWRVTRSLLVHIPLELFKLFFSLKIVKPYISHIISIFFFKNILSCFYPKSINLLQYSYLILWRSLSKDVNSALREIKSAEKRIYEKADELGIDRDRVMLGSV